MSERFDRLWGRRLQFILDGLQFVEDFENGGFGVRHVARLDVVMQQVKSKGGCVQVDSAYRD